MKSKSRQHSQLMGAGLENKENFNRENVDEAQEVNDQQLYEDYSPEEDMNRDDDYGQENNFEDMDQDYQGQDAEQFPADQDLHQENEREEFELPRD